MLRVAGGEPAPAIQLDIVKAVQFVFGNHKAPRNSGASAFDQLQYDAIRLVRRHQAAAGAGME